MSDSNNAFKPLRTPSRISNICTDGDPGFPTEGKFHSSDLPASAGMLLDKYRPEMGDDYAVLSALLSMQAYCAASSFKPEKSVLCYLLRIKDAVRLCVTPGCMDKAAAGTFMLGLDALAQLGRISDILTSPPAMQLYSDACRIHAFTTTPINLTESLTHLDIRIVNEVVHFEDAFRQAQAQSVKPDYIERAKARYYRWVIMTAEWLNEPNKWRDKAEREIKNHELLKFGDSCNRSDPIREQKTMRPIIEFYANTLNLGQIAKDLPGG